MHGLEHVGQVHGEMYLPMCGVLCVDKLRGGVDKLRGGVDKERRGVDKEEGNVAYLSTAADLVAVPPP